jgi:uncharacterized membrane protein YphA (DoxX/SURF4 family)
MIVAVHFTSAKGFFWTQQGLEYSLLILIVALVLAIRGGGDYSVDQKLGREIVTAAVPLTGSFTAA